MKIRLNALHILRLPILVACVVMAVSPAIAQKKNWKDFYGEGLELMAAGKHQDAIKPLEEALRQEKKPQRYRYEGNFFADYMPRYQLALCYETIDVLQAEDYAKQSIDILESDIIRKKKDLVATYHSDINRIGDAAESYRKEQRASYDLALGEARSLVDAHRYADAKKAFEALHKQDPSRPEAMGGLNSLIAARNTYLKGLGFDVQTAIMEKNWQKAESVLARMKDVDSGYAEINTLTGKLVAARKKQEEDTRVASTPVAKVDTPQTATEPKPKTSLTPRRDNPGSTTVASNQAPPRESAKAKDKKEVREALVASLKPYRRGDMSAALARLKEIPVEQGQAFGSYHWLKGVYLLSVYEHAGSKDEALKSEASTAMTQVARLLPNFKPDETLYPSFVIRFYENVTSN